MKILAALRQRVAAFLATSDKVARSRAVDGIEYEVEELEHIFALLVMGSMVGLPSPPLQLSLELMPLMEKEMLVMIDKIDTAANPLSDLFSVLDVD